MKSLIQALNRQHVEIDELFTSHRDAVTRRTRELFAKVGARDRQLFVNELAEEGMDEKWAGFSIAKILSVPQSERDKTWYDGITTIISASYLQAYMEIVFKEMFDLARVQNEERAGLKVKHSKALATISQMKKAAKKETGANSVDS